MEDEAGEARDSYVCAECYSAILRGNPESENDQHDEDCPVRTNYWTVTEFEGIGCDLCGKVIPYGADHRFIPRLPEDDETYDVYEQPAGLPLVVCVPCCRLRVVHSVEQASTG